MAKFCGKCGDKLKNENDKFCDKCGSKISNAPRSTNTTVNTPINNAPIYKEKSMPLALILSFLLPGIGIVYAGDVAKGLAVFIGLVVINFLLNTLLKSPITPILSIALIICSLYLTYEEVNAVNEKNRKLMRNQF